MYGCSLPFSTLTDAIHPITSKPAWATRLAEPEIPDTGLLHSEIC